MHISIFLHLIVLLFVQHIQSPSAHITGKTVPEFLSNKYDEDTSQFIPVGRHWKEYRLHTNTSNRTPSSKKKRQEGCSKKNFHAQREGDRSKRQSGPARSILPREENRREHISLDSSPLQTTSSNALIMPNESSSHSLDAGSRPTCLAIKQQIRLLR